MTDDALHEELDYRHFFFLKSMYLLESQKCINYSIQRIAKRHLRCDASYERGRQVRTARRELRLPCRVEALTRGSYGRTFFMGKDGFGVWVGFLAKFWDWAVFYYLRWKALIMYCLPRTNRGCIGVAKPLLKPKYRARFHDGVYSRIFHRGGFSQCTVASVRVRVKGVACLVSGFAHLL